MGLKNFIVNGKERTLNYETGLTNKPTIPTTVEELADSANYVKLIDGLIPNSYLPSYVDDVLEFSTLSNFPTTGESGKIYLSISDNKSYRWSGSQYVEISSSLALGETSSTAYAGDKGAANATNIANILNGTTKLDYNNLINKPSIPSLAGYATQNWVTNTALSGYAKSIDIPTDNNQLANGAGYITNSALSDYTLKSNFNSEVQRLDGRISAITGGEGEDVPTLDNVYTKLQTDNAINAAVTELVNGAPGALNTLKELSTALGDDANFATTVTNKLTEKVDKTTTINEKPLNNNITLTKEDIGLGNVLNVASYSKEETDDLLENISGVNSTDTSTKIYLIGATSQSTTPNTYSDNEVYVTNGVLTTKQVQIGNGSVNMQYDSSLKALKFVFA